MRNETDSKTGMAYVREGKGPLLLLVHGFPLSSAMWSAQLEAFSGKFCVLAPDLPGFGTSPLEDEEITLESLADLLANFLDNVTGGEPVIFLGLSMGGYIGWPFAQRHRDRLRALVQCHTRATADTGVVARGRRQSAIQVLAEGPQKLVGEMLNRMTGPEARFQKPELMERLQAIMSEAAPATIATFQLAMATRADSTGMLPGLDLPVLVVAGEQDHITPPDEMREMADLIPGARYCLIRGAGHMSPMERPEEFNRCVLDFLEGDSLPAQSGVS